MRQRYKALCENIRETTDQILKLVEENRQQGWDKYEPFVEACCVLLCERFPRSWGNAHRENAPKILAKRDKELYDLVQGSMLRGLQFRYAVLQDDKEQFQKARGRLVERGVVPLAGDKRVEFAAVYDSTYRSQGYGARHYAQGSAKLKALEATCHGIKHEITEETRTFEAIVSYGGRTERTTSSTFRVFVFVQDEFDVEILKDCPKLDLRSAVKACWGAGVNPRVYNPFLPHGYEESVGLDYFGGETRKASGA